MLRKIFGQEELALLHNLSLFFFAPFCFLVSNGYLEVYVVLLFVVQNGIICQTLHFVRHQRRQNE